MNPSIIAAIIPSALFLFLILYYTLGPGKILKPKIMTTREPLKIIGVSTKTSNKTFVEDDLLLWKEYKRIKEKKLILNKKEEFSFVAIRKSSKEESWEYLIGDIVTDFNNVPVGLKTAEIPVGTYAAFHIDVDDERSWAPAIIKTEKYIYEKWLPKSIYELDTDSPVKEIEYHDKRTEDTTRTMIFYVAIREKKKH